MGECFLDLVHSFRIEPKGLLKHVVRNMRAEQGRGNELRPGVLCIQRGDGGGHLSLAGAELKVDETLGEHEHIALTQVGREELPVGVHESHEE